jgi:chemotaxis protein CheD
LINGLLALGARRHRLEAKLFGGARMSATMADIGLRNAEFARRFLADERIPLVGESLGGSKARRVQYWPAMGRVQQQLVTDPTIMVRERSSSRELVVKSGEVELF